MGHVLPHPQSAVTHSVSSSRNPSPIPPQPPPYPVPLVPPTAFVSVPAPPSPVPAVLQAAYGYDPSYCQYLGQAADGYQYELVRRPSLGNQLAAANAAASELAVPSDHVLRRPSTGSPYPPPPHSPYGGGLAATSLHGSFDSCSAEAGTRPMPSPSAAAAAAAAAAAVGPPLLVSSSHSPSYHHHHSSQHVLYHAQPAPTAAQPVLFTQQPPFQPASYQMYRHHSVSSSGGALPSASSSSAAPGYHPHLPPAHAGLTPQPPPPVVGHMQSAFRMVGDHVEATAATSELSMPKMIHETSI